MLYEYYDPLPRSAEIPATFSYVRSEHSSVTTPRGSEEYIAQDIMRIVFAFNPDRLTEVQIVVKGTKVIVSAPAACDLERLFCLGSEKGEEDIGQRFKAAAVCLLRDYEVEPVVISGNSAIYIRVDDDEFRGTERQPVIYDFFQSLETPNGTTIILPGCSKNLIRAFQDGMNHFFDLENPLLDTRLWSSRDGGFSIYGSSSNTGHVFYRGLKRGEIPDIPVILVIDKKYAAIEMKIRNDRDCSAFGEELMKSFYRIFARCGLKNDTDGQRSIVLAARPIWTRGHPLLREIAEAVDRGGWPRPIVDEVFGKQFYARSTAHEAAETPEYARLEQRWREEGREPLPTYFAGFGVPTARHHCDDLKRKLSHEALKRHHRAPTVVETKSIELLTEIVRMFAPETMVVFHRRRLSYRVAETELVFGELKQKWRYSSQEVFLSSSVFVADLAQVLAIFLHEHTHIVGHDGSREFCDALTELIETVIRNRKDLDAFEEAWEEIRAMVRLERQTPDQQAPGLENALASMNEEQLRELLNRLPPITLRRALESGPNRGLTEGQDE